MSGSSRRFPRHFLNSDFPLENEGKDGKNLAPRLGLEEVPDALLPDHLRPADFPIFQEFPDCSADFPGLSFI